MMNHHNHGHTLKHKSNFRVNLVELALYQAQQMKYEAHHYAQNVTVEGKKLKAVYDACLKLYDNTIYHLNRTVIGLAPKRPHGSPSRCSSLDAQTWLSTALTNIQTCKNGAKDLKLDVPELSNTNSICYNVSKMISNGLAINAAFLSKPERQDLIMGENSNNNDDVEKHGFPKWFSRNERKLVTVSATKIKANLVVAKDGSGHFKTVQAAIDAAAKRKYKTRFVIRVKKGVYNENIEVDKSNGNIMLIGAGLKYTVITSSKGTSDGITTYGTATAGMLLIFLFYYYLWS